MHCVIPDEEYMHSTVAVPDAPEHWQVIDWHQ